MQAAEYRPLLTALFTKYVDPCLEHCRRNFKYVVPLPAVNQAMSICKILEGILPKETVRGAPPPDKKLLHYHFVFACIWAFGGCMLVDKVSDYRSVRRVGWRLGRLARVGGSADKLVGLDGEEAVGRRAALGQGRQAAAREQMY